MIPDVDEPLIAGDITLGWTQAKISDPVYMVAWVARLADTTAFSATTKYADAVTAAGFSPDAVIVLASRLTEEEIADPAFLASLSGLLSAVQGIVRQPGDATGSAFIAQVEAALSKVRNPA